MKKKLLITLNTLLVFGVVQAQIVNRGGTITVQAGATLVVEGNVDNESGTISNSGTIEIKGNFNNAAAAILSGTGGTYHFTGTGPSSITSGGVAINNLTIDKSVNGVDVSLEDALTVDGILTFGAAGNSNLVLGTNNLTLGSTATVSGAGSGGWIEANRGGNLIKSMPGTPTTFIYPIGSATTYLPLTMTSTATGVANTARARIDSSSLKPVGNTNFTNNHWIVASPYQSNYTGVYDNAFSGVNTNIVGFTSTDNGTSYSSAGSGAAGSVTVTGAPDNIEFRLTGYSVVLRQISLSAFLQGATNSGGTAMNTTLVSALGIGSGTNNFPNKSPYSGTSGTITDPTTNNIVDWVLVQLVVPSSPGNTFIAQRPGLLRSNGVITDTAGLTTFTFSESIPGSDYSIRIKHRNHLSVRSVGLIASTGASSVFNFDFSNPSSSDSVFTVSLSSPNINSMLPQKLIGSRNCLWGGDVTGDDRVRYTQSFFPPIASDVFSILNDGLLGNTSGTNNTYNKFDLNLDGRTRFTQSFFPPIASDVFFMLSNVLNLSTSAQVTAHN